MQAFYCKAFCVLRLIQLANSHGAMKSPVPRNNERNATHVQEKTMAKYVKTSDGILLESFLHAHAGMCSGPATSATVPANACIGSSGFSELYSTSRPSVHAKMTVDCTLDNDCRLTSHTSAQQVDVGGSENTVWMVLWYTSDNCSGSAEIIYKLNNDACTAFDGVELSSTTPGCEGLSCLWFSQGCGIGCPKCTEDNSNFFSSPCNGTMSPTINDPLFRTFNRYGTDAHGDWTASHPWRAPGSAPVMDACGMAGGSTKNNDPAAGYPPAPDHKMGDLGSNLMPSPATVWEVGSTAEVAWGIWANHGGGYQYRLCSKAEALTEDCFQKTPLPFANETQKLRLEGGKELQILGSFVSVGTLPQGSTWAMNPIPACSGWTGSNCTTPQFPPPAGCDEHCWGYLGPGAGGRTSHVLPTIVDQVLIPEHVAPGDYVLGWRWDCEQTPQVWASCADVAIVAQRHLIV